MTDTQRRAIRTAIQNIAAIFVVFGIASEDEVTAVTGAITAVVAAVFAFIAGKVEDRTGHSITGPRKDGQ